MIISGKSAVVNQRMKNDRVFNYYMSRFAQVATPRFKWENMGPYFDTRFCESCLFTKGWVTIWWDSIAESFLCGNVLPGQGFDINGNIKNWRVVTPNSLGFKIDLNNSNAVIIYDSKVRLGFDPFSMRPYAPIMQLESIVDEMCLIHQSMMQNINSLGCPIVITGTKEQRTTLENKLNSFDLKLPYIFVNADYASGKTNSGELKALRTECPNNIQGFRTELDCCWNEGLCVLGVDNLGVNKKERLLTDEAESNDVQTSLVAEGKLQSRQEGLKKLNEIYDSNCKVSVNEGTMYVSPYLGYNSAEDDDGIENEIPQNSKASGGVE